MLNWRWQRRGDAARRDEILPQSIRDGDSTAAELVRALAPAVDPDVQQFWRSDAGNAASPAGRRWLDVRCAAFEASAAHFGSFVDALSARGLLRDLDDDLVLPKAVFE